MIRFKKFLFVLTLFLSIGAFTGVSASTVQNLIVPTDGSASIVTTVENNEIMLQGFTSGGVAHYLGIGGSFTSLETSLSTAKSLATPMTLEGGDYTLSVGILGGTNSGPTVSGIYIVNIDTTENLYMTFVGGSVSGTLSGGDYAVVLLLHSDSAFSSYNLTLQLEEGNTANDYVPYTEPIPPSVTGDFIQIVGAWVTGMWVFVASSITGAIAVFYDNTPETGGLTTIGILSLFGLALSLVMFGLAFVKGLIKK